MCAISNSDVLGVMSKYAFESIGTQEFCQRHNLKNNPCSLAPTTAHVSLFKGATILGVGKGNLIVVPVDENARMDIKGTVQMFVCNIFLLLIVLLSLFQV